MSRQEHIEIAAALVGKALMAVAYDRREEPSVTAILDSLEADPKGPDPEGFAPYFEVAKRLPGGITPAIWVPYLVSLANEWTDQHKEFAVVLPTVRATYPSPGDEASNLFIDEAVATLADLSWDDYGKSPEPEELPGRLLLRLHALSLMTWATDPMIAYDLASLALDLGASDGPAREAAIRDALTLALEGGRSHQIAACEMSLAVLKVREAASNEDLRLIAFDRCEIAAERIGAASEPFKSLFAKHLASAIHGHPYLHTLLPVLVAMIATENMPENLKALGGKAVPRVNHVTPSTLSRSDDLILPALERDAEVEAARLALLPPSDDDIAETDWISWTISHPAYRRAVPSGHSFLREADFDRLTLVLTHEVTHVVSLLGTTGLAVTCLRAALVDQEVRLWSIATDRNPEAVAARMPIEGIAPMRGVQPEALLFAETAVEFTLKAQAIQDAWTPWLEGLALYGELAADPALDATSINEVTGSLRGLVDYYPDVPLGAPAGTYEEQKPHIEKWVQEFEKRCSAAIAALAPNRLEMYCRLDQTRLYFVGYLAVRSVVAAWRRRLRRPIPPTAAYMLLMHATRFGTYDAIPDLGLDSATFREEAVERMVAWAAQLARVDIAEMETFFEPIPSEEAGRNFNWVDGHLLLSGSPGDERSHAIDEKVDHMLRRALASLSSDADVARAGDGVTETLLTAVGRQRAIALRSAGAADLVQSLRETVEGLLNGAAILPIGQTTSKFMLTVGDEGAGSYLWVHLRTTEKRAGTGKPGFNIMGMPLDREAALQIESHYKATADPRINVYRLIDLNRTLFPFTGQHVFAFSYGEWFDLLGCTGGANALLRKDPDHFDFARKLIKHRVQPPPMAEIEQRMIAPGREGALRTLEWLDGEEWPDLFSEWASHIADKATSAVNPRQRESLRTQAMTRLLATLWEDGATATAFATQDYDSLVDAPELRSPAVAALFSTAQGGDSVWLASHHEELRAMGLDIFATCEHGWDVRPAR